MEIQLKAHQINHTEKLINILERSPYAFDLSPTGTGKTYVSSFISQHMGIPMLVICPARAVPVWEGISDEYKLDIVDIVSYEKIRGNNCKYLHRYKPKNKYEFALTDHSNELITKGCMVICDEAQHLKNDSLQSRAVSTITAAVSNYVESGIIEPGAKRSSVLFLSATLYDQELNSEHIYRLLGFGKGYREIFYNIYGRDTISPIPTKKVQFCKHLNDHFVDVICKTFSSTMPESQSEFTNNIQNMKDQINEEDVYDYLCTIDEIEDTMDTNDALKIFNSLIQKLQLYKAPILVRETKQILKTNPRAKVILFSNYLGVQGFLMNELDDYNPVQLCGETKKPDRADIISLFQEDNSHIRVLVVSTQVANVGISLHDIHGDRPRYVFILPGYNLIDMQQACGRAFRTGSLSNTQTRIVFGQTGKNFSDTEQKLMERIWEKSKTLKSVHYDQSINDGQRVKRFACDFTWES